ncbi:MAG: PKD domain-containing protein, partial [Candidatus Heimdallarchaeaceae archaeon]
LPGFRQTSGYLTKFETVGWNGEYWLIGGAGGLVKFDGESFQGVCFIPTVKSVVWNGEYWLIGTREGLFKYDGLEISIVNWTEALGLTRYTGAEAWRIGWNGKYWLIGGENIQKVKPFLLKFDGINFEDLSNQVNGCPFLIKWNGFYWLISTWGFLYKYDGFSFVDISSDLRHQLDLPNDTYITGIWGENYWLIGIQCLTDGKFMGSLIWYNGSKFIDLSTKHSELSRWGKISVPVLIEKCGTYFLIVQFGVNNVQKPTKYFIYLLKTLFDFQLSWDSSTLMISDVRSAKTILHVNLTEGSYFLVPGKIKLSFESPKGFNISFYPSDGTPDFSPIVSISIEESVTSGNYSIVAIGEIGKIRRKALLRIVLDTTPPVAEAGSDKKVKANTEVGFDASASSDNMGIVRYEWDFGDGTTGTGVTTTHTYTKPGTYTVTLKVTDAAGNSNSDTLTVVVEAEPGFPTWLVVTISAVILLAIITIYAMKRK